MGMLSSKCSWSSDNQALEFLLGQKFGFAQFFEGLHYHATRRSIFTISTFRISIGTKCYTEENLWNITLYGFAMEGKGFNDNFAAIGIVELYLPCNY